MKLCDLTPENKTLVLGTALWGWGISRHDAYELLERFLVNGGTIIDTATNYPINKCDEDFGLAVRWVAEWIKTNGISNLSLIIKIGSIDNLGSPNIDLMPENIIRSVSTLCDLFGEALSCISIHWDNRNDEENQLLDIDRTVKTMAMLEESDLSIGMSGVRRPDLYYKAAPHLSGKWIIQVKENVSTRIARQTYMEFFPRATYLAYGINMGGLKIEPAKTNSSIELRKVSIPVSVVEILRSFLNSDHGFEPRPTSLNELALASSYVNPALSGVIIGPRNVEQLVNTMGYWQKLQQRTNGNEDFDLFDQLAV